MVAQGIYLKASTHYLARTFAFINGSGKLVKISKQFSMEACRQVALWILPRMSRCSISGGYQGEIVSTPRISTTEGIPDRFERRQAFVNKCAQGTNKMQD